jgi:nucleoside-diphosphate-sugar epimerase
MNQYDFEGRTAIVTGGGQGIGLAVARRMLAGGARVSIWDRDEPVLADGVAELAAGDRVQALTADIGDLGSVERATAEVMSAFGRIDVLINNAAIVGPNAATWEYPPEAFRDVVNIGLIGTFYVCRTVVPHMIAANYGRMVNLGSVAGKEGNPKASAYSSTKAGIDKIARQGVGRVRYFRQCRNACGRQDHDGAQPGSGFSANDPCQDPAWTDAGSGRGGRDDLLAGERGEFLHDRRGVRPFRRSGDLLTAYGIP